MSWWYHPRDGYCRPLPGGPYIPRVFSDPTCAGTGVTTVSWTDIAGIPDEFPPEDHTHTWGELEEIPACFPPCDHEHPAGDITGVLTAPLREPDLSFLTDPSGRVLYPPASLQSALNRLVPSSREIRTTGSLTGGGSLEADRTLSLVNDVVSPGPERHYATDALGVKGWHEVRSNRFTFSQAVPLVTWVVVHNLGFRPRVAVDNLAGQAIMGDVVATGINSIEIRFGAPVAGVAYLG